MADREHAPAVAGEQAPEAAWGEQHDGDRDGAEVKDRRRNLRARAETATPRRISNGRVGADTDMIFYNQLSSLDGSVRHGGEQTRGSADLFEELQVDLPAVPASVHTIAVCASIHAGTFAQVTDLHVRLEGDTNLVFAVPSLTIERAVVLFEIYRRHDAWKVRAIGQGYADGLAGLARDFGVDVD